MVSAICLSNISWYMPISLLSPSPAAAFASRMLFSIICRNSASTCCATACSAAGELGSFLSPARPLGSLYVFAFAIAGDGGGTGLIELVIALCRLDHDQLRLQAAGFSQGFQDGHGVARARSH